MKGQDIETVDDNLYARGMRTLTKKMNNDLACARMVRLSRNTGLALCCMNPDSFTAGNEEQAIQYFP